MNFCADLNFSALQPRPHFEQMQHDHSILHIRNTSPVVPSPDYYESLLIQLTSLFCFQLLQALKRSCFRVDCLISAQTAPLPARLIPERSGAFYMR